MHDNLASLDLPLGVKVSLNRTQPAINVTQSLNKFAVQLYDRTDRNHFSFADIGTSDSYINFFLKYLGRQFSRGTTYRPSASNDRLRFVSIHRDIKPLASTTSNIFSLI